MADAPKKKKLQVRRKSETIREKADKSIKKDARVPRTRKLTNSAAKPLQKAGKFLVSEYHPVKTGNSKVGKALSKRRSPVPTYFIDSITELRLVSWPSRRTALKLMGAVFLFSLVFATIIRGLDFGFEKLFRNVILK